MTRTMPTDPYLLHLDAAMNEQFMATVFADAAGFDTSLHITNCRVDRIKYRPRRNCSVSYQLQIYDPRANRTFDQWVACRFCGGNESLVRYQKHRLRASIASATGPRLQHVPQLDLLAAWLPNDSALPALADLMSEDTMRRRWLPQVVESLGEGNAKLLGHSCTLVQIVPEQRACARVELTLQLSGGVTAHRTVYAKTHRSGRGGNVHRLMQALWDSPAQQNGHLNLPRTICWQPESGLHWQAAVAGRALLDAEPIVSVATSAKVGAMLAHLHATVVNSLPVLPIASLQSEPAAVTELLSTIDPAWQSPLSNLNERLAALFNRLNWPSPVTLHGDLHARNLLLEDQRLTFIDFDSAVHGPAALELADWIADTLYRAILCGRPVAEVTPAWQAFLQAYQTASGHPLDLALLRWCTAHQLLCVRAYRCARNLKSGQLAAVPVLIELAMAILQTNLLELPATVYRKQDLLDIVTDPEALSVHMQSSLPGFSSGQLVIEQLRVLKVRRSASRRRNPHPLTLVFEANIVDRANGTRGIQSWYGKVCRPGCSTSIFASIDPSKLVKPTFGPPLAHIKELELLLWAAPNDPTLPQLLELLDPKCLRRVNRLANAFTSQIDAIDCAIEQLRYEPEVRAMLKYTLTHRNTGASQTLYAKTFSDGTGQAVFDRFTYFWELANVDQQAPMVAQPLAYDRQTQTVWQTAAAGIPLRDWLAQSTDAQRHAQIWNTVATAIARVHAAPLTSQQRRSQDHWLAQIQRRQTKVARAAPEYAPRVARIADSIQRYASRAAPAKECLIHGDFHIDQLWIDRNRLVLFDFDEMSLGDPMEDLAELIAKLSADEASDPCALAPLASSYQRCAPEQFDRSRLQWHLSIQYLLQASRSFVFQRGQWRCALANHLTRAEDSLAWFETADGSRTAQPTDTTNARIEKAVH